MTTLEPTRLQTRLKAGATTLLAMSAGMGTVLFAAFLMLSTPQVRQPDVVWKFSYDERDGCFYKPGFKGFPLRERELGCLTAAERESVLANEPSASAAKRLAKADELYRARFEAMQAQQRLYDEQKAHPLRTIQTRLDSWFGSN